MRRRLRATPHLDLARTPVSSARHVRTSRTLPHAGDVNRGRPTVSRRGTAASTHRPHRCPQVCTNVGATRRSNFPALGPAWVRCRSGLWITARTRVRADTVDRMDDRSAARRPPRRRPLPPAARLLWRSAHEVQLELGSTRGRRERGRHRRGPPPDRGGRRAGRRTGRAAGSRARDLPGGCWGRLAGSRLSGRRPWRRPPRTGDPRRPVAHPRLAGELTALCARAGDRAAEMLAARRHSTVLDPGRRPGRPAARRAARRSRRRAGALADTGPARLHQADARRPAPGRRGDVAVAAAAALACERQAPEADYATAPFGEPPDLVVLAVDEPVDPERRNALHARAAAHLLVQVSDGRGSVGPLVLPGLTSCLRCADLHRLDRDPAWDALAVQLSITPGTGSRARSRSPPSSAASPRCRRWSSSTAAGRQRRGQPRDAPAGLAVAAAQLAHSPRLRLPVQDLIGPDRRLRTRSTAVAQAIGHAGSAQWVI